MVLLTWNFAQRPMLILKALVDINIITIYLLKQVQMTRSFRNSCINFHMILQVQIVQLFLQRGYTSQRQFGRFLTLRPLKSVFWWYLSKERRYLYKAWPRSFLITIVKNKVKWPIADKRIKWTKTMLQSHSWYFSVFFIPEVLERRLNCAECSPSNTSYEKQKTIA